MTVGKVFSASPFETQFGFCRALRVGDVVHVAGTAPIGEDGAPFAPGDAAAQARRCFQIGVQAIESLGGEVGHVVRTRMFLTNIDDWPDIGRVHGEFFAEVQPVSTMVEVSSLIDPAWRIEVEMEALIR